MERHISRFPLPTRSNFILPRTHPPRNRGGLKNISSFISRDPILVYNGDILTNLNLEALFKTHTSSNNLATLALFSSGPNPNVAVQDNQIIDLRHSRGIHPGTHQFTGIYVVEPEILRLIPSNKKISVVPAFLQLAEQNQLGSYIADGASWHDLGTPDEYFAAHQYLRQISNNPKSIHPTAVIHPSADIDLDTCVVGRNCVIEKNVKLRHTIAWPETTIKQGTSLENIIITPQCQTAF